LTPPAWRSSAGCDVTYRNTTRLYHCACCCGSSLVGRPWTALMELTLVRIEGVQVVRMAARTFSMGTGSGRSRAGQGWGRRAAMACSCQRAAWEGAVALWPRPPWERDGGYAREMDSVTFLWKVTA
jgi:hypothetical protein